ncbi:MAG: COX15/CtaA family protein [Nevskia sp.]|nr:COX15/CtaA family protein [Nevskia sp.]
MLLWFRRLNLFALLLCFLVVVFGAYVRLSDAGLGCPDWPGCYGRLTVPEASLARSEQGDPQLPIEAPKAWKEMIHRYLAGTLALSLFGLALLAWSDRRRRLPRGLTLALVATVCIQAALGALTVIWKVNPLTVTAHLLVGLTTLSLLWWLWLAGLNRAKADEPPPAAHLPRKESRVGSPLPAPRLSPAADTGVLRSLAAMGLLLLVAQIFLGGWTSSNYAAAACPDFPACQGSFLPRAALGPAFALWHGLGVDYQYGILDGAARATIHLVHRYGAAVVSLALIALALALLRRNEGYRRILGAAVLGALALQLAIGVGMVELHFPLWLADAHNAGAALLLLSVVAVNYWVWNRKK